jgi:ribosomal protein S13
MYILHMKCPWITLNMVYGVSKELSHKILVHKLMDSSQSIMELGNSFAKTVIHRIFVIYLDQEKLKASS